MDFYFSPEDEAFRREVREFIRGRLPSDWDQRVPHEDETFQLGRQNALAIQRDDGKKWLTMAWPREFGGQNANHWRQMIFNWEQAYWRFPVSVGAGISLAGPSIMIHGSDEQKQEWLPRIASAEEMWCQMFTEPGSGSDLASLQTRAVEDGDDYVINGQKIFTSGAHHSQLGWLMARTDPTAPKHRGISMFICPTDLPGITVRPLINMAGHHEQNEVFFDDVRLPKQYLVGEKNRGWYIAATTLDFERSGVAFYAQAYRMFEELVQFARETRRNGHALLQEPGVRNRLADRLIELEMGRLIAFNIVWMQSRKLVPNREASESKVWAAEMNQRLMNTGMQILGLHGQLRSGSAHVALGGRLEHMYRYTVVYSIFGGSSEVNRNIIATRGLGLPR